VRVGGRATVLPPRRRGDDQCLRVRRALCRHPARLGLVPATQARVRVLLPHGLHRLPAGGNDAGPARPGLAASLARLVRPCRRGVVLAGRAAVLALGTAPLPGRRRMSGAIIETDGLSRQFRVRDGKRRRLLIAVDGLTVRIEPGEAVGYIGANGAGKSTTIKMLTGILVPTAGSVLTCGLRPVPDRRRLARQVGVVFGQRSQLWWDLPVRESFRILAAIHALPRAQEAARTAELADALELGGFWSVPVRQLSLGQRMRAEVAAA